MDIAAYASNGSLGPSRAALGGQHRGRRDLHWWLIARGGTGVEQAKSGGAIAVEHRGRTAGCVRLAVIPGATTAGLTSLCEGRGCASDRNGSYRCLDRHSPKWESTIGLARADTDDTQRTVYPGLTLSSAISRHGYDVPITESVLHIFSAT